METFLLAFVAGRVPAGKSENIRPFLSMPGKAKSRPRNWAAAYFGSKSDHFAKYKNTLAKWSAALNVYSQTIYATHADHFATFWGFGTMAKWSRPEFENHLHRQKKCH